MAEGHKKPPRSTVPMLGIKERVRFTSGALRATITNSWRQELYLLLGIPGLLVAAYFIKKQNIDATGSLPAWSAMLLIAVLLLLAAGCLVMVFWKPRAVVDKTQHTLSLYTWRIMARPYLTFSRDQLLGFVVEEIRDGAPDAEPLYFIVRIETAEGERIPLCRLNNRTELHKFDTRFAQPLGLQTTIHEEKLSS